MNATSEQTPAQIAKAALRRLAVAKLEPTPENYAQAWAEECGTAAATLPPRARTVLERLSQRFGDEPAQRAELLQAMLQGQWDQAQRLTDRVSDSQSAQAQAWAQLIERLTRALERGGKQWSVARKKESLQRVLDSSRSDVQRLQHRLRQLIGSWDSDGEMPVLDDDATSTATAEDSASPPAGDAPTAGLTVMDVALHGHWVSVVQPLESTVRAALPPEAGRAVALADELAGLAGRLAEDGATPELAGAVAEVCGRARRLLAHRHHLLDQVHRLSQELAGGLAELSEDESWVQGQLAGLKERLGETPNARGVQAAAQLLAETRARQQALRQEREQARQALKDLLQQMLAELGELDQHTGRFSDGMLRYAETVQNAQSLESLAEVVREMVAESRSVHGLVSATRGRLQDEHRRASELETQVRALEAELRRLSDEVATDALTQVANRRGLMQQFEVEQARIAREGASLAIGLLDIDNFKRLNDTLGHTAGDEALKALAEHVRSSLRPVDAVARFGGEEFVVLLPGTPVDEAQQVLTRLQRQLSASLFMHENKEVFVTFSAGVTQYRAGESLEEALERADEALYEAKRTGKNRTCVG
ncbi:diguanylate cyclase [Ideonella dechloratans]|uniref:diguanylate cyclase n=1 Tax=Ideonella dechloratans TaxID=36863 RepID=A0A643FAT8_IDEDE|nr:GGDEF domain-containing protein [Ideonella dechloratans]KAB0581071.1 diguanylate cyclase [Ideonella dechloratans]UFU09190.1 diguanylate cyclase [Ideonella dechloratans]